MPTKQASIKCVSFEEFPSVDECSQREYFMMCLSMAILVNTWAPRAMSPHRIFDPVHLMAYNYDEMWVFESPLCYLVMSVANTSLRIFQAVMSGGDTGERSSIWIIDGNLVFHVGNADDEELSDGKGNYIGYSQLMSDVLRKLNDCLND